MKIPPPDLIGEALARLRHNRPNFPHISFTRNLVSGSWHLHISDVTGCLSYAEAKVLGELLDWNVGYISYEDNHQGGTTP